MAAIPRPDKEAIRAWLRGRRQSKAPPPSIEQIKVELFSRSRPDGASRTDGGAAWCREQGGSGHS